MALGPQDEWIGGTSDVPTVAANWQSGIVPVSNDVVIVGSAATQGITGANQVAITLDLLRISEAMTYNVGSSGSKWIINATALEVRSSGAETWLDGTFTHVLAGPKGTGANSCQLDGTLTTVVWIDGTVAIDAGATVTDIFANAFAGSGKELVIPTGTTLTNLTSYAGLTKLSASVTGRAQVSGGTVRHLLGTGTLVVVTGGTYEWYDGTITKLIQLGGTVRTRVSSNARTLTNATIMGGVCDLAGSGVVMTNPPVVYGTPSIYWPQAIGWTPTEP